MMKNLVRSPSASKAVAVSVRLYACDRGTPNSENNASAKLRAASDRSISLRRVFHHAGWGLQYLCKVDFGVFDPTHHSEAHPQPMLVLKTTEIR